jgi:hypothetical protein
MDDAELETLVSDAARIGTSTAHDRLLQAMRGRTVYFNATPGQDGAPAQVATFEAAGRRGVDAVSSRRHPDLRPRFGGMPWERALEMAAKMPALDGLFLRNEANDWIFVDRASAARLAEGLSGNRRPG